MYKILSRPKLLDDSFMINDIFVIFSTETLEPDPKKVIKKYLLNK